MRSRQLAIGSCILAALCLGAPGHAAENILTCAADLAPQPRDGQVGVEDFFAVLQHWGPCPITACPWDCAEPADGEVGVEDFFFVLQHWGPCTFDYGEPYPNPEAEQIAMEMNGPAGPLRPDAALYDRIDRDLGLIRAAYPKLADQTHTMAWAPDRLIVQKVPGQPTDGYDALNVYFQLVEEDQLFGDFYVITFPGRINVEALAVLYVDLPEIASADPDGLIGGSNDWEPLWLLSPDNRMHWHIDDGWHDCFDGCDCHEEYDIQTNDVGDVELIDFQQWGWSWCEFDQ
jgi:hypothetical protein